MSACGPTQFHGFTVHVTLPQVHFLETQKEAMHGGHT